MDKKYLLDTNILIDAHRRLYPFDIAPGFWDQLLDKASDRVVIIEKVNDEIMAGEDQLTNWYSENKSRFIIRTIPDQPVMAAYTRIINSINDSDMFKQAAKDEFASIADSWLCAYGLAYNYTIITNEIYKANIRKRIPIPNICREFNINYIDLLKFMREEGFIFR